MSKTSDPPNSLGSKETSTSCFNLEVSDSMEIWRAERINNEAESVGKKRGNKNFVQQFFRKPRLDNFINHLVVPRSIDCIEFGNSARVMALFLQKKI